VGGRLRNWHNFGGLNHSLSVVRGDGGFVVVQLAGHLLRFFPGVFEFSFELGYSFLRSSKIIDSTAITSIQLDDIMSGGAVVWAVLKLTLRNAIAKALAQ